MPLSSAVKEWHAAIQDELESCVDRAGRIELRRPPGGESRDGVWQKLREGTSNTYHASCMSRCMCVCVCARVRTHTNIHTKYKHAHTITVLPDLHPGDPEPAEIQHAKASKRNFENGSTFLFATAAAQKSARRLVARTADGAESNRVSNESSPRTLAVPDSERLSRTQSTCEEERLVGELEHKHRLTRTSRCA